MDARQQAAGILGRVVRQGAYSNVLVRQVTGLPDPDRRQVQRLVYGALRHLAAVDQALGAASTRPIERIQHRLLDVLRIAATEILYLDVPPYAAVSAGVDVARGVAGEGAAKFANAVLRRIRPGDGSPSSFPEWIDQRLAAAWGTDAATAFRLASDREAPIGVRKRGDSPLELTPVLGFDDSGYASDPAAVGEAVAVGNAIVVDPASTAVGAAVAARAGECILDVAAAPGGKTAHLWDAMEGRGLLVASDLNPRRLRRARARLEPMAIRPTWMVMDGRRPAFGAATFDRVLLDAPCTGLGTLRRRPEIRHRLTPGSPERMAGIQRAMLETALTLVRPGGRVVYSVCTVFPEETIEVVAGLGGGPPAGIPGEVWGDGLLLGPSRTGTDGMFISVLDR